MNLPGQGRRQEGAGVLAVPQDVLGSTRPSLASLSFCVWLIAVAVDSNSVKDDKNFICLEPYT